MLCQKLGRLQRALCYWTCVQCGQYLESEVRGAGNMRGLKFRLSSKRSHRSQFSKLQGLCVCTCRIVGQNVHSLARRPFGSIVVIFASIKCEI